MVSAAGIWNLRPAGWKVTAFTPSPVGAVIVMVVGCVNAPGGITRVCGPALIDPPAMPIVCVLEAYGRSEHLSRPVGPSSEPMRLASGVGRAGDWGLVGSPQEDEASKTRSTTANARTAFIGPSPYNLSESPGRRGPAEVQNGTIVVSKP